MDIPELLDRVDILDYISQYTSFEQRGREYWALSPLKQENTTPLSPSTRKSAAFTIFLPAPAATCSHSSRSTIM